MVQVRTGGDIPCGCGPYRNPKKKNFFFEHSIADTHTFTLFTMASTIKNMIVLKRIRLAVTEEITWISSWDKVLKYAISATIPTVSVPR